MKHMTQSLGVDAMLPRVLTYPFVDLTGSQFQRGLELYGGSSGAPPRYLGSVNYVDPSLPIELPEAVNFLKIKFNNSLSAAPTVCGVGVTGRRCGWCSFKPYRWYEQSCMCKWRRRGDACAA